MPDISSYYNQAQNQYLYKKTASNASNSSGASLSSGLNGASGVSGTTGVKEVSVTDLTLSEVIDLFTTGNLTENELKNWLNAPKNKNKVSDVKTETNNNVVTYNFKYNNKQYTISCAKDAAKSQTDKVTQELKTENELLNSGFTKGDLSKYFIKASNYGTEKYALKPDCGYKTIAALAKDVKAIHKKEFQEAQSNLIMQNFINGKVTYKSEYTNKQFENATVLKRTSDGTTISSKNYEQYADEISKATGGDVDKLRKEALAKFKRDFARGDVAFVQAKTILKAIGVENYVSKQENGNYNLSFDFEGEHYSITCNEAAAKSGVDNIKVNNFEELKEAFYNSEEGGYRLLSLIYESNNSSLPLNVAVKSIKKDNVVDLIAQLNELIDTCKNNYQRTVFNDGLNACYEYLANYNNALTPLTECDKADDIQTYGLVNFINNFSALVQDIDYYNSHPELQQAKLDALSTGDTDPGVYINKLASLADQIREIVKYSNKGMPSGDYTLLSSVEMSISDYVQNHTGFEFKKINCSFEYKDCINELYEVYNKFKQSSQLEWIAKTGGDINYQQNPYANFENTLHSAMDDISKVLRAGALSDYDMEACGIFAQNFNIYASWMPDLGKNIVFDYMMGSIENIVGNEVDGKPVDYKEARFFVSLVLSASNEFSLPEQDIKVLEQLNEFLNSASKAKEPQLLMDNPIYTSISDVYYTYSQVVYKGYRKEQAVTEIDKEYIYREALEGTELLEDSVLEIISSICEYDSTNASKMDILNFVEYAHEIIDTLAANGFTHDDIYGKDGLVENDMLKTLILAAVVSGDMDSAISEIAELTNNCSNKKKIFETEEELCSYAQKRMDNGLPTIFDMSVATMEASIKAKKQIQQLSKTDFNEQLVKQLRASNAEFSYENFSSVFGELYSQYATEIDTSTLPMLTNNAYAAVMRTVQGMDTNASIDDVITGSKIYFQEHPGMTFSDIEKDPSYERELHDYQTRQNSENYYGDANNSGGGFSLLLKGLDYIVTGGTVSRAIKFFKRCYNAGCKDEYGMKTSFSFKNLWKNRNQVIIGGIGDLCGISGFGTGASVIETLEDYRGILSSNYLYEYAQAKFLDKMTGIFYGKNSQYNLNRMNRKVVNELYPEYYNLKIANIVAAIDSGKLSLDKAISDYGNQFGENFYEKFKNGEKLTSLMKQYIEGIKKGDSVTKDIKKSIETILAEMLAKEGGLTEEEYNAFMHIIDPDNDAYKTEAQKAEDERKAQLNKTKDDLSKAGFSNEDIEIALKLKEISGDKYFVDGVPLRNVLDAVKKLSGKLECNGSTAAQIVGDLLDMGNVTGLSLLAKLYTGKIALQWSYVGEVPMKSQETGEITSVTASVYAFVPKAEVEYNYTMEQLNSQCDLAMLNASFGDLSAIEQYEDEAVKAWQKMNQSLAGFDKSFNSFDENGNYINRDGYTDRDGIYHTTYTGSDLDKVTGAPGDVSNDDWRNLDNYTSKEDDEPTVLIRGYYHGILNRKIEIDYGNELKGATEYVEALVNSIPSIGIEGLNEPTQFETRLSSVLSIGSR